MQLKNIMVFSMILLLLAVGIIPAANSIIDASGCSKIEYGILNSPPVPPIDTINTIVNRQTLGITDSEVILFNVPTSKWTYGCGPTAAGMVMGYYDRAGFPDMYTGPCNNGVCPLTNLGQGTKSRDSDYPVPGSCYIIATEKGLDGVYDHAHVDDYWVSYGDDRPDPWEDDPNDPDDYSWPEHEWELCLADFMGTNQWKWDSDGDKENDCNTDGSTMFWYYEDGSKLYGYGSPRSWGLPSTSTAHGIKLFAESRGYIVDEIYNQLTDAYYGNGGFTYNEFKNEINNGRPVLSFWQKSSGEGHLMVGIGYKESTNEIYIHDTWDNNIHKVGWDGQYSGFQLKAVTVLKLKGGAICPIVQILQPLDHSEVTGTVLIQGASGDSDGVITRVEVKIDDGGWKEAYGTENWNLSWDTTVESEGIHVIYSQSIDDDSAYSPESSITITVNNNEPPTNPICKYNRLKKELIVSSNDSEGHLIRYGISWDNDMTVDTWTDYYNPGEEVIIDCGGADTPIGVVAEDDYPEQSEWVLQQSKNKEAYNPLIHFFMNTLDRYLIIQQLIKQ